MNFIHIPFSFRFATAPLVGVVLLSGLVGCSENRSRTVSRIKDNSSVQVSQSNLTFNDVTLEQADERGQIFWKVKAKQATYRKDKKVAQVQQPDGELFQDGKVVYTISAAAGIVKQDGKQLFLNGNIVATDPRNGTVLRGDELEWRPKEDLLIVRKQLSGTHKQLRFNAREARANSRSQRIDLQGQVVANTTDSALQLRTEHVIWQIPEQKLIGDRPVQIDRYKGKTITDRATANQAEMNLKTNTATLKQNAQLALVEPPLQVTSNDLNWNINAQIVTAAQPVQIVHRQKQMTVTANQGKMDLQKEIVYLTGDARGLGQRGQSINSTDMTWYLPSQLVEANGNVVYRQVEPPLSFAGQKAVGKLQDQNLVVSGGRVVTEIIP